jgi:hypothetical protein
MKAKMFITVAVTVVTAITAVSSISASANQTNLYDSPSGVYVGYVKSNPYHNGIDFMSNSAGLLNNPAEDVCRVKSLSMYLTTGGIRPSSGNNIYRSTDYVAASVYNYGYAVFRHRGVDVPKYVDY